MNKYLYNPKDIALFFCFSDYRESEAKMIRDELWAKREELLDLKNIDSKYKWIKEINRIKNLYTEESFLTEADAINNIFKDLGSEYVIDTEIEIDCPIESFFKIIRLKLTSESKCYHVRMKLRVLLKNLGYKRRNKYIIEKIKKTTQNLNIVINIKGYVNCDLLNISLDDMVVFRLNPTLR